MGRANTIFERKNLRRALALFACATLLYFAAGGSFLHQHSHGPETTCHVCQSLHAPALAVARLQIVSTPEVIGRYVSLPKHEAPNASFTLHRAGRAPPLA